MISNTVSVRFGGQSSAILACLRCYDFILDEISIYWLYNNTSYRSCYSEITCASLILLSIRSGIRLAGGDSNSGRVEVRFLGTWGTVCDDLFGTDEAKVVCRMLGNSWGNAVAYGNAHFGQGSGPIFYDDLGCTGTESDLFNCQHSLLGHHDCGHDEDAGVHCA
ncbi:deleted in malignant brain tumors 1 protein-like [Ostrea edulis]|uniref:deleted in malignant brain tumors 1 protein-like n=1 Tax=Ostrea edulis TaxID=37623 RepID=UPI0024AFDF49|nr:deleted in malignant brain tumors 1 protein-like [Ostrea edulis]